MVSGLAELPDDRTRIQQTRSGAPPVLLAMHEVLPGTVSIIVTMVQERFNVNFRIQTLFIIRLMIHIILKVGFRVSYCQKNSTQLYRVC